MTLRKTATVVLTTLLLNVAAYAQDSKPEVDAEFGAKVRAYLLENPEVIVEVMQVLEQRQVAAQAASDQVIVAQVQTVPGDVVMGNPDGDITVYEFFDYRCGWCQRAHKVVNEVLAEDANIRLVMKQFPILGPASVRASQLALAARAQGADQYTALHTAMMDAGGQMSEDQVLELAQDVGLDIEKLLIDAEDASNATPINQTYALAERLNIRGTPAFIIGQNVARGYMDKAAMTQAIATARAELN